MCTIARFAEWRCRTGPRWDACTIRRGTRQHPSRRLAPGNGNRDGNAILVDAIPLGRCHGRPSSRWSGVTKRGQCSTTGKWVQVGGSCAESCPNPRHVERCPCLRIRGPRRVPFLGVRRAHGGSISISCPWPCRLGPRLRVRCGEWMARGREALSLVAVRGNLSTGGDVVSFNADCGLERDDGIPGSQDVPDRHDDDHDPGCCRWDYRDITPSGQSFLGEDVECKPTQVNRSG